jgi:hypothetical protein
MDFTPEEEKMISWLQRQHAGWRTTRIITLVASALAGCISAWEFFSAGFGALPLLLLVVATFGLSHTLGSWAGRPEISLLLKLVESARARTQS